MATTPEMTWTAGPHGPSTVSTVIGAVASPIIRGQRLETALLANRHPTQEWRFS